MSWVLQDIEDLLQLFEDHMRARGGLDVAGVLSVARDEGMYVDPELDWEVLQAELDYRMALQREEQLNGERPVPLPHTVRWYQAKADEPVSAGSNITVRQACFCLATLKLRGGTTVRSFNDMCKLIAAGGFLPAGDNAVPRCAHHSEI